MTLHPRKYQLACGVGVKATCGEAQASFVTYKNDGSGYAGPSTAPMIAVLTALQHSSPPLVPGSSLQYVGDFQPSFLDLGVVSK